MITPLEILFSYLAPPRPLIDEREFEAVVQPTRSIVGFTVANLSRLHDQLSERREELMAEIARMTEELRQVNASIEPLAASLTTLAVDPALTKDEVAMAEAPVAHALEAAVSETRDVKSHDATIGLMVS